MGGTIEGRMLDLRDWGLSVIRKSRILGVTIALVIASSTLAACTSPSSDPSATEAPVRTEPVPAPTGGTVEQIVETPAPAESVAHSFEETAEVEPGVTARIDGVESLQVEAKTPGEVNGPAVAVTIIIDNQGADPIDVSSAMVSLFGSADVLGQPTTSDPYAPFSGVIEPGAIGTGTYVFLLPEDARDALTVSVQYMAGKTIALFSGQA